MSVSICTWILPQSLIKPSVTGENYLEVGGPLSGSLEGGEVGIAETDGGDVETAETEGEELGDSVERTQ